MYTEKKLDVCDGYQIYFAHEKFLQSDVGTNGNWKPLLLKTTVCKRTAQDSQLLF